MSRASKRGALLALWASLAGCNAAPSPIDAGVDATTELDASAVRQVLLIGAGIGTVVLFERLVG